MINVQRFRLDIKQTIINRLRVVNGDTANQFVITVTDDKQSITLDEDLDKVIAVFTRADGAIFTQDAETGVSFTENGEVTVDVRPSSYRTGSNKITLQIYHREEERDEFYPFLITTQEQAFIARASAIPDAGAPNAPSQLPMLEQIIHDAGEAVTNCNTATADATAAATSANNAASSANSAASAANSAASAANAAATDATNAANAAWIRVDACNIALANVLEATTAANNAASSANSAASAANDAADAANDAADAANEAARDAGHAAQDATAATTAANTAASAANTAAQGANAAAAVASNAATAATNAKNAAVSATSAAESAAAAADTAARAADEAAAEAESRAEQCVEAISDAETAANAAQDAAYAANQAAAAATAAMPVVINVRDITWNEDYTAGNGYADVDIDAIMTAVGNGATVMMAVPHDNIRMYYSLKDGADIEFSSARLIPPSTMRFWFATLYKVPPETACRVSVRMRAVSAT